VTPEQFAYWLQGFFELRAADPAMAGKPLSAEQEKMIQDHLATVFVKVTPDYVPPFPDTVPVDQSPIGPFYPPIQPLPHEQWTLPPEIICQDKLPDVTTCTTTSWKPPGRSYCESASSVRIC
jgi:hypothetical protein